MGREAQILKKIPSSIAFHFFTTIKLIYTLIYQSLNSYFFLSFRKYESFSNCHQSYYRNIGYLREFIQNVLQSWPFYQIFRWSFFLERDISMICLWAQAYNNNTFVVAAITGAWGMDFVSSSPLFSTTPPFFQNFHINHSFYKIFIIIRFFII